MWLLAVDSTLTRTSTPDRQLQALTRMVSYSPALHSTSWDRGGAWPLLPPVLENSAALSVLGHVSRQAEAKPGPGLSVPRIQ